MAPTTKKTEKKPAAKKPAAAKKPVAKKPAAKKAAPAKAEKAAPKKVAMPDKYTVNTMAAWVAETRGVSRKEGREIIDAVFELVEAGVMSGNRVPMGTMGKVMVKVKPATKARMGRNPLTGESIKIAAKKATKVPRFTFSKAFKEAVLKAKTKD